MLSKTEIISLLEDLDLLARDYDKYEYGLPLHDKPLNDMISIVEKHLFKCNENIDEIIEARKKQFEELKK